MWLVLCVSNDVSAFWAYEGLKARGLAPVELVTAEMLSYCVRWEHRLGADGVYIDITLADGRRIRNDTIRGALNRLLSVPSEHLLLTQPADREYTSHELHAFFMSWLYSLPQPVLNRPTPQGLSGQWRHVSEWVWLASKAGLPTSDYRQTSRERIDGMGVERRLVPIGAPLNKVIVVEGYPLGVQAPAEIHDGCRRLAELSGTALLGIDFCVGPAGSWTFAGATALPDLRLGGEPLLAVLASVLRGELEEHE